MNKNELCVNIKLLHENEKLPYKKEVAPNVYEYGLSSTGK